MILSNLMILGKLQFYTQYSVPINCPVNLHNNTNILVKHKQNDTISMTLPFLFQSITGEQQNIDQIRLPKVRSSRQRGLNLTLLALPCITCYLNFSVEKLKCEGKCLLCLVHLYLSLNDGLTALRGAQSVSTPCCHLWWWVRLKELLKFPTPPSAYVYAHTQWSRNGEGTFQIIWPGGTTTQLHSWSQDKEIDKILWK